MAVSLWAPHAISAAQTVVSSGSGCRWQCNTLGACSGKHGITPRPKTTTKACSVHCGFHSCPESCRPLGWLTWPLFVCPTSCWDLSLRQPLRLERVRQGELSWEPGITPVYQSLTDDSTGNRSSSWGGSPPDTSVLSPPLSLQSSQPAPH